MKDQLPKARDAIDWFKQTLGAENFYLELQNHGIARAGQGQPPSDSVGEGVRPEARRDERRSLRREEPFARARLPDLHRHAIAVERSQADERGLCAGAILSALGRGNEGALCRSARSGEEHAGGRREVQSWKSSSASCITRFFIRRNISRAKVICANGSRKVCCVAIGFTHGRRGRSSSSKELTIRRGCRLINVEAHAGFAANGERQSNPAPLSLRTSSAIWNDPRRRRRHQSRHGPPPNSNSRSSRRPASSATSSSSAISFVTVTSKGISCVARGSAAGSIVTYLLEIANVDPIRYGLLFERFPESRTRQPAGH